MVDRARVRLAGLALERGDSAEARRWIEPARLSRLGESDLRNAYRALAESAERPAERLRWLAFLRGQVADPAERAALDLEIDTELAALPADELAVAARQVGDRPPAARLYLALAERALADGRTEEAREALAEASRRPLGPSYAARLAELSTRLGGETPDAPEVELPGLGTLLDGAYPEVDSARGTLGVLLPLTGPFAPFGERALQGVLLAAGIFEAPGAPGPRVRVVVRDTAGDPRRAAAAVRELADEGAVALLGPLISAVCEAAAEEAESIGVPLLALSARESIARDREWVFRMRTRPAEEAERLVDHAMAQGDRSFAILYPDHAAGMGYRTLFWDAVEARGGRIVGVSSYDPEATDFGDSIRALVGYSLLDAEERELLAKRQRMLRRARRLPDDEARKLRAEARSLTRRDGRPIPPIVDFDALLIPDSHQNVVLIAPQLAFHEATGARLLGTDAWNGSQLLRVGGRHLEGSVFVSSFHAGSGLPHGDAFAEHFARVFGSAPETFAAQSYDAARLVLVQLDRGNTDPDEIRDALLSVHGYPGVSGVVGMRSDGNARKRPFLVAIEDGELQPIED